MRSINNSIYYAFSDIHCFQCCKVAIGRNCNANQIIVKNRFEENGGTKEKGWAR